MSSARRYLDQVHSLPRLDALDAGEYARLVAAELPPTASLTDLEARDAQLAAAHEQLDVMIARAMRIRLDHVLAADTSIPAPTRNVFATTIVGYAGRLPLLAQRARDVAARGGAKDADAVAELVVDAARAVLDLRDAMRAGLLELVREDAARREELENPAPEPEKTFADMIELD